MNIPWLWTAHLAVTGVRQWSLGHRNACDGIVSLLQEAL